ncbi:DUF882 domain-containing protein [Ciceribacter sp. L1K22]|uniref:DUF882 domain-containing protein n=1 Tax=Ciceribacter sp. L1K22 TaxID=2820275 RepID=UPI0032B11068
MVGRNRWAARRPAAAKVILSAFLIVLSCLLIVGASAGSAAAETRSLKIHFVHTGEKAEVVFKRNGKYDAKGLRQLSYLVRDWRRNEPTKMDPRLFDLVWEVYRRAGAKGYITVVSGYRSPATNAMLRSRSKGVAKESQHMKGTAMDFYIPGVPLKTLREIGIKLQAGGVGYYPKSGSPFVHMDVAGVRAWPRMSRQDLARLFPDGKTVHIPADGKPLPGYQQALAEYKKRLSSKQQILIADADESPKKRKNLFAILFGGGDEDEEEDISVPAERPTLVAAAPAPEPPPQQPVVEAAPQPEVAIASLNAPVPLSRPSVAAQDGSLATALYSPNRSPAQDALTQVTAEAPANEENFADLQSYKIPVPTLLGARNLPGQAEAGVMTASVSPDAVGAMSPEMAAVPVPLGRPAIAEALLASADGMGEADVDEVEQAILSPEAAAAIEQANTIQQTAAAEPAPIAPMTVPVPAYAEAEAAMTGNETGPQYIRVASLQPKADDVDFGDVFDAPKPVDPSLAAGLPTKGGRPTEAEAQTARIAMQGGTKLTKDMIASWALNSDRFEASKATKAPRVVSRTLTTQPSEVYSVGFKSSNVVVDPARFGIVAPATQ